MAEIQIVPVGAVDRGVLEFLALSLGDSFAARFSIADFIIDPADAYNASRRQYHSTEILAKLVELESNIGSKILGVADVDLFIPILTFVFGEAQLSNRAALISSYRLRQSFYGLPEDERLFYERCEKEAAHELGHAFGLVHCRDFECVMHFSNSIEQVDLKRSDFCRACFKLLKSALNRAS